MKKIYNELKKQNISAVEGLFQDFAVTFCKDLGDDFEVLEGMVDFDEGKLFLAESEDAMDQIDTLVHECLHIILDGSCLGEENEVEGELCCSNEELVVRMTPAFIHFLKNNKRLVKTLLKSL
jgi:hypothetical protein